MNPDSPSLDPYNTPDLNAALAKAQGEMSAAKKDAKNAHFGSKYADMASVMEACKPLSAHGIAVVQFPSTAGPVVTVTTILRHASGQTLDCGTISARARDEGPQSIGSVLTYLRRYGLMAAVGLGSADDDGQAGQPDAPPPASAPAKPAKPAKEQAKEAAPKETPAEKEARQDSHDPSWESEKGQFFIALKAMDVDGADVQRFAVSLNRPRPSQMISAQRAALVNYLSSREGRAKFDSFLKSAATEEVF